MGDEEKKDAKELKVICSYCKRLLHRQEVWEEEGGMSCENMGGVSHGICPDCLLQHYPAEYLAIQEENRIRIRNVFKKGFADMYGHIAK